VAEAVADASAVLARIEGEPGGDRLREYHSIHVCAVNHAEVIHRLVDWGSDEATIDAALRQVSY